MAFEIGYTDQAGATGYAHKEMLLKIKALAEANGWITLRYDTSDAASHELILQGEGLSGEDEIFIGVRTYENVDADYYNLAVAGFTGYVPGNVWSAQPGFMESGVPAHNQRCDYWLAVNAQRIFLGLKVGTPVYETAYVGFFLPFATPGQYPYPLCVIGMLDGADDVRYSDTAHSMGFKGDPAGATSRPNCRFRWLDGTWKSPEMFPWNNATLAGGSGSTARQLRDTDSQYPVMRVIACDSTPNIYGTLDGVGYVSNFNNTVESTIGIDGTDWLCLQDVGRTSFTDYIAVRMD